MLERCKHTKRNACLAALSERMHANSCCPGNYHLDYANGWFYRAYGDHEDEPPFQDPELTARAEELLAQHRETGEDTILFATNWNTYVVKR